MLGRNPLGAMPTNIRVALTSILWDMVDRRRQRLPRWLVGRCYRAHINARVALFEQAQKARNHRAE